MSEGSPTGAGPADRHGRLAPSPEVLKAIELAIERAWPRASAAGTPGKNGTPYPWRFSGRSWAAPLPLVRSRPIR